MQNNNQTGKLALARTYHYGFYMYSDDYCELARPDSAPLFDTCDWTSGLGLSGHLTRHLCTPWLEAPLSWTGSGAA